MVSPNDHEVRSLNPFTNGIGSNHMGEALTQNFYRKVQNSSMTQLNSSQHSGHFPEKKNLGKYCFPGVTQPIQDLSPVLSSLSGSRHSILV